MIEKKINNLKDRFTNVHMSIDDKRDVFKSISLVVDKIEAASSESYKSPVVSPFSSKVETFRSHFVSNIFVYVRQRKFVPSLAIVLLLCVTGGVSALAEDALPGDSLYSLKVNVNEQVKGFVAVTPEAKARLAVETTERRLQEAVILSSQGKLTDENKQIIQGQLSKNATDVKNSVATLVASDNISVAQEVAINFEASLKTHELILETIAKNADASAQGTSTTSITVGVNASTTEASSTTVIVSTSTSSSTDSNTLQALAVAGIPTVSTPVTSLMQDIRQEIVNNAQVRADLSQKEIAEATDPTKIASQIEGVKVKYADLLYQRKTLTDLSPASIKLFDNYLGTASSTIKDSETALNNKDLPKSIESLQQAIKSLSDSDSLLSIELNSKPAVRKALELIDITKLLNSIQSNSTSTVSTTIGSASNGSVLGTSTTSNIIK